MYLAVVTYGAVIVPILPDFKPDDLHNIINHSDSKLLFIDDKIWEMLDPEKIKEISGVKSLDTFELIMSRSDKMKEIYRTLDDNFKKTFPEFNPADIKFSGIDNEQLAVLSYTSGTTGFSKGVMVPHRSLAANIVMLNITCPWSRVTPSSPSSRWHTHTDVLLSFSSPSPTGVI